MACYPNDCLLVLLVFSRFFGQPKAVGLSGCGFPAPAQIVISTSMAERGITTDDLSQQLHPFLAPTPARSINTEQQRMAKLLAAPQWGWRQSFCAKKRTGLSTATGTQETKIVVCVLNSSVFRHQRPQKTAEWANMNEKAVMNISVQASFASDSPGQNVLERSHLASIFSPTRRAQRTKCIGRTKTCSMNM